MANYLGTNVGAPVVPFTTEDKRGTHYSKFNIGGFREVDTLVERDAIPVDTKLDVNDSYASGQRKRNMFVYVSAENRLYHLRINGWSAMTEAQKLAALADNNNWEVFAIATDNSNKIVEGLAISVADKTTTVTNADGTTTTTTSKVAYVDIGKWKVNGVEYVLTATKELPITAITTANFKRIDLFIAKNGNELIEIIEGVASDTNAVKPSVPANAIEIGFIIVTDAGVEQPEPDPNSHAQNTDVGTSGESFSLRLGQTLKNIKDALAAIVEATAKAYSTLTFFGKQNIAGYYRKENNTGGIDINLYRFKDLDEVELQKINSIPTWNSRADAYYDAGEQVKVKEGGYFILFERTSTDLAVNHHPLTDNANFAYWSPVGGRYLKDQAVVFNDLNNEAVYLLYNIPQAEINKLLTKDNWTVDGRYKGPAITTLNSAGQAIAVQNGDIAVSHGTSTGSSTMDADASYIYKFVYGGWIREIRG